MAAAAGIPEEAFEPLNSESLRELQRVELGILLDIARVCEELGIAFFLGEGTLLGAVRHAGFIPWDDDIDLLMVRDQYDRFLAEAPARLGPRYQVQHFSTVAGYWSPILKVRLVDPEVGFRQRRIEHLTADNGPLVDIFPMDYVPASNGLLLRLRASYIAFLRSTLLQKLNCRQADTIHRRIMRAVGWFLPVGLIHRQLDWAFRLSGPRPRHFLATLTSYQRLSGRVLPAHLYAKAVQLPFEGHLMPVPVGYHEVLTAIYGDYLTPPPLSARGIKHDFERRAD